MSGDPRAWQDVEVSPELREQMSEIDPDVLAAAVKLELRDRRDRAISARRAKLTDPRSRQPAKGRYRAVSSGAHHRTLRPQAKVEDRKYVAGALRHWRTIHELSPAQAQVRIGYSARSSSWRHWEAGFTAPPYETLLRVIAGTGLGLPVDQDPRRSEIDPAMLLEYQRAQHRQMVRRRARARQARRFAAARS